MKYSEFKAEVEKMGYWVDIDHAPIYVDKSERGETIIAIGKHKRFSVDPGWSGFHSIPEENQIAIYNLAHALTVTPLAEREEEKRYYLRNASPLLRGSGRGYLAKNKDTLEYYALSLKCSEEFYQTVFTESEISQMDITGFEKVEVTG